MRSAMQLAFFTCAFVAGCVVVERADAPEPAVDVTPEPPQADERDVTPARQPAPVVVVSRPSPVRTLEPPADDPEQPPAETEPPPADFAAPGYDDEPSGDPAHPDSAEPEPPQDGSATGYGGWKPASAPQPWPAVELPPYEHMSPLPPFPLTAPKYKPWRSGRALAVHKDELYAVAAETDQLVVLSRYSGKIVRVIEVGARPEQVVIAPSGAAFVTVRHGNAVIRVEPGAAEVSEVALVGAEPYGLALDEVTDTLYVSVSGAGQVVALSASDLSLQTTWTVFGRPRGVAVGEQGVWIGDQFGQTRRVGLYGVNVPVALRTTTVFGTWGLGEKAEDREASFALAVTPSPSNDRMYTAHTVTLKSNPQLVLGGAGGTATNSGSSGAKYYGPPPVFNKHPELTRLIETTVSTHMTGPTLSFGSSAPVADPVTGEPLMSKLEGPVDINHHPTHTLVFVVGQGTDNVLAMTASLDPSRHPVAELKVGRAPRAVAFSPDGGSAYVLNAHDFTVSRVDLAPLIEPGKLPIVLVHTAEAQFGNDPLPKALRAGRRAFMFARNGAITDRGEFSCNTCHFEGTEDKVTWVGPSGMRQTPLLAGRVKGTSPFNWKGSKDSLQDNMSQTIERMKGTGLSDEVLDSLALFLEDGMHPPPNANLSPEGLNAEQQQGKLIFEDPLVGCAFCHVGGESDGKQHDVGTLDGLEAAIADQEELDGKFNTPSLKGLYYSAPYLHDGEAADLWEVLEQSDMGNTSVLTNEERYLLIEYLLTL